MHPLVVYDVQHVEHALRRAETHRRWTVLRLLADRRHIMSAAPGGPTGLIATAPADAPTTTDFVRVS